MVTKVWVDSRPDLVRYMHLYNYGSFVLSDAKADGYLERAEFAAFEEDLPMEWPRSGGQ